MRWRIWVLVAALACAAAGKNRGDPADYVGGTVAGIDRSAGFIDVTDEQYFRFQAGRTRVEVLYETINLLEYGQKADRRYLMAVAISPILLLSKKRKHFLTVGYADDQGRQQALIFRVDKAHIRSVLASLEARTGRKVEYQDTEARKAGSG